MRTCKVEAVILSTQILMTIRTILFYNTMYGAPLDVPKTISKHYRITTDKSVDGSADIIVFHLPDLYQIPYAYKPNDQIWVAWCIESDVNYPFLKDDEIMQYFDLKMTYRLDSDVPYTYLYQRYQRSFRNPPAAKTKMINAFISSYFNQSKRLEYLKELMDYVDIDSYGRVFNNSHLPGDDNSCSIKESLITGYKFTIAFENSISRDYVTEKFFQPLAAGSVPIYLGAPNVEAFAPGAKSFINVLDFDGAKSLANYIRELDRDDESYLEYFEWKNKPFNPPFTRLLNEQKIHPFKRLCDAIDNYYLNQ